MKVIKKLSLAAGTLVVAILIVRTCSTHTSGQPARTTPVPAPQLSARPAPPAEASWKPLRSWSGAGMKTTEPFTVRGTAWRVRWSSAGGQASYFGLTAHRVGEEVPISFMANLSGRGEDVSYVYESGDFVLRVNGANTRWTVAVETAD